MVRGGGELGGLGGLAEPRAQPLGDPVGHPCTGIEEAPRVLRAVALAPRGALVAVLPRVRERVVPRGGVVDREVAVESQAVAAHLVEEPGEPVGAHHTHAITEVLGGGPWVP